MILASFHLPKIFCSPFFPPPASFFPSFLQLSPFLYEFANSPEETWRRKLQIVHTIVAWSRNKGFHDHILRKNPSRALPERVSTIREDEKLQKRVRRTEKGEDRRTDNRNEEIRIQLAEVFLVRIHRENTNLINLSRDKPPNNLW